MERVVSDTDAEEQVIRTIPVQVWLARIVCIGVIVMLVGVVAFGGVTISAVNKDDSTIYTAESNRSFIFIALSALVGILAVVYSLRPGVFRLVGIVLGLITCWLAYTATAIETSNHHVTVSPTKIIREVGTRAKPIRHEIDFTRTTFLAVEQVSRNGGPEYELVASATANGTETRIPIYDLMRAALPQIMENAAKQGAVIGESEDGLQIPTALRSDDK